ncbi:MAG: M1 family metallopeptidase [Saprospiraceae bacterium]|nr:M1 family metallopeptidase [Saprospiraceae bacterium]
MKKIIFLSLVFLTSISIASAQSQRWQQRVAYTMDIDVDAAAHQYRGTQRIVYTNNSPDTLTHLFFHLFFNAFQPGSMMDVRNQTLPDADPRVADRISKLKPEETGWIKVESLTINGVANRFETNETILEVQLQTPILPGAVANLDMQWDAQVPLQIRRSGRDNREGVEFSMAQWYPKLCEYDDQGWHSNPYIGREFYGVWGDFDVTINIDKNYLVAAGGYLQNPQEIGFGYEASGSTVARPAGDKLKWHFFTPNVHDFVWAADPDFTHKFITADDGTIMRFIWQKGKGYDEQWEQLPAIMNRARTLMNQRFGKYPYKEYAFIQGGDGGMEYPLATLITGKRPLKSLVGVSVHEHMHTWYQMLMGTNESLYAWMDEGFTDYATTWIENELAKEGLLPGVTASEMPYEDTYNAYRTLVNSGKEEPLSTHADFFETNYAYGLAAYVKGAVFIHQLEYIVGKQAHARGLLRYYHDWKFKHPTDNDFIRVMEKESGLELDWYRQAFVNSLATTDYAVQSVEAEGKKSTRVTVERIGRLAMPLDIVVTYTNGDQELFYIPLESMRGIKPPESTMERTVLPDHRWVDSMLSFEIPSKSKKIESISIDPTHRLADMDFENNTWNKPD